MIRLKTSDEITILREGGKRLAEIMQKLSEAVRPGVSTKELDDLAFALMKAGGDSPALLHFRPKGARRPYPATLCVSVNDEVVHGIPNERQKILKEGDIVGLDTSLKHNGLITDMAITVPVGQISKEAEKLLETAREALYKGISVAKGGGTTGDIGYAIEKFVERAGNYGIVRDLSGHGVGFAVHEDPFVPNYGRRKKGDPLLPGTVIAIEPMINMGGDEVVLEADGYTYRTADGSLSAHFEHTVAITDGEPIILTL